MLRIEKAEEWTPWTLEEIVKVLSCPVCGSTDFTLVEGHGIFCDACNARVELCPTAGDRGVNVDVTVRSCRLNLPYEVGDHRAIWFSLGLRIGDDGEPYSGTAWMTNLVLDDGIFPWRVVEPVGQEPYLMYRNREV